MNILWEQKTFDELRPNDLYAILQARQEVFVVEQNCAYLDIDGYDLPAHHLIGYEVDSRQLLAYCRLLGPGTKYAECSIGRVLTTEAGRGHGFGRQLLREAITRCEALFPGTPNRIMAQSYLRRFYESFGFVVVSDEFSEDDIPHYYMLRPPSTGGS